MVLLALLLLLAGVAVMAYPSLSDYVNQLNGSYVIRNLQEETETLEAEELSAQRTRAEAYNTALAAGDLDVCEDYEEILNFAGGVMGYLEIPKIDVNLPIFHGVSDEVLAKGAGHLPQSAFPIGGTENHAVLTGHTGLPGARLFTDLTKLETGDMFYIYILEQVLIYEVDQIRVVLPSQADALSAVPGEDYCTLVTCTPYGINSHRLLVRGTRVKQSQETAKLLLQETVKESSVPTELIIAMIAAAMLLVAILAVLCRRKKSNDS